MVVPETLLGGNFFWFPNRVGRESVWSFRRLKGLWGCGAGGFIGKARVTGCGAGGSLYMGGFIVLAAILGAARELL